MMTLLMMMMTRRRTMPLMRSQVRTGAKLAAGLKSGRGQRLAGRDHAVTSHGGRTRAAEVAGRAIAGLNLLRRRGGHDQEGSGQREEEVSHRGILCLDP